MSTERELLIGIAVDVSYSMKSSIRNDANEQYSRFDSFRIALKKLAEEAKRTINQNAEDSITSRVNTFIYVYGLQNAENSDLIIDSGVCDYLSLIQVAKTLKNTGNTDIKKTQEYEDLRKIAYQYDLGKVLDDEVLNAMKVNKKATRNMIRRLEIDRDSRVELSEYIKKAYGAKETAEKQHKKAHFVTCDNYVTMTDGTGVVHIVPAFGEDDSKVGRKYDLPF